MCKSDTERLEGIELASSARQEVPRPKGTLEQFDEEEILDVDECAVIKTIENPLQQREIHFLDEEVRCVIADLGNAC